MSYFREDLTSAVIYLAVKGRGSSLSCYATQYGTPQRHLSRRVGDAASVNGSGRRYVISYNVTNRTRRKAASAGNRSSGLCLSSVSPSFTRVRHSASELWEWGRHLATLLLKPISYQHLYIPVPFAGRTLWRKPWTTSVTSQR